MKFEVYENIQENIIIYLNLFFFAAVELPAAGCPQCKVPRVLNRFKYFKKADYGKDLKSLLRLNHLDTMLGVF